MELGADGSITSNCGKTALHYAALNGHDMVVSLDH